MLLATSMAWPQTCTEQRFISFRDSSQNIFSPETVVPSPLKECCSIDQCLYQGFTKMGAVLSMRNAKSMTEASDARNEDSKRFFIAG